ncbi:MAG: hypothetical protein J2O39_07615, partial [Acidimicrobiales bacterium]|nr:hypothetical protein [Acidimicrobiales bacterium]
MAGIAGSAGAGRGEPYLGDGQSSVAKANRAWLYAGRALRSFSTAFLTVVFPLYLANEGYSSAKIGLVLTVGGFISAATVLGVGLG